MICNIIDGILDGGLPLSLFLICEEQDERFITEKYRSKVRSIRFHRAVIPENKGKYHTLLGTIAANMLLRQLSAEDKVWLRKQLSDDTIILSHCPTLEPAYLCREIKGLFGNKYIQYWSDPITLSGILPEQLNVKRIPYYLLEKKALGYADEVVYGTKTLYRFQKELFGKYAEKMRWAEFAYCKTEPTDTDSAVVPGISLVYSGNYYSNIRNILPLYQAVQRLPEDIHLSIYGSSDLQLQSCGNVSVHGRVSHEDVSKIEAAADIMVCILNLNCIQIPGKVFYNTNSSKRILVIVDGKYGQVIKEDLENYQRIEVLSRFLENNFLRFPAATEKSYTNLKYLFLSIMYASR